MNNERYMFRVYDLEQKTYDHKFPYNSVGLFYIAQNGRLFSDFGNAVAPEIHTARYIIEQCTGLRDKKGHLIFEGDILEAGGRRYVVCLAHHGFVMRFTPGSATSYPLGGTDLFEIVGNVNENPIKDNVGETK